MEPSKQSLPPQPSRIQRKPLPIQTNLPPAGTVGDSAPPPYHVSSQPQDPAQLPLPPPPPQLPPASATTEPTEPEPASQTGFEAAGSALTTAFREARHFAGGLVSHPSESTKHYSVLRHSTGLVYYKGPSTSLAVTVFSSPYHPIPSDRTLWLQPKGWLGKAGWRAKSLVGLDGNWLNVTPAIRATVEQLNPSDERAWQRDIKRFIKKGPSGHSRTHVVRETDIVRIPVEATDGYFRLVLCTGPPGKKKTLCASPAFRVASTSTSPSSIRGASLGTLPLELGAMALSKFASTQASTYTGPVTSAIQQYQPGFMAQEALTTGYGVSGLQNRVVGANDSYTQARDLSYDPSASAQPFSAELEASGPNAPYPIQLTDVVVPGTGASAATTSLRTANLKMLRDDLAYTLNGYYFGWARVLKPAQQIQDQNQQQPGKPPLSRTTTDVDTVWHESIISALPKQTGKSISVVHGIRKGAAVHLIHDFGPSASLVGATLEVLILGFLRPLSNTVLESPASAGAAQHGPGGSASDVQQPRSPPAQLSKQELPSKVPEYGKEAALLAAVDDVALTQTALSRSGWHISDLVSTKSGKLFSEQERAQRAAAVDAQAQQAEPNPDHGPSGGMNRAVTQPPNRNTHAPEQHRRATFSANNVTGAYVGARQGVQRQIDKVPFHRAGIRVGVDGLRDRAIGQRGVFVVRG